MIGVMWVEGLWDLIIQTVGEGGVGGEGSRKQPFELNSQLFVHHRNDITAGF